MKKLIILLDDTRNDIYVHVDKEARGFNIDEFDNLLKYSKLTWIERMRVSWGAFSLVRCEMALLNEAVKGNYSYYHLLSGVDLPIKQQDQIHQFYNAHAGQEFVTFHDEYLLQKVFFDRIRLFHFFQGILGNRRKGLIYTLNRIALKAQESLKINRINGIENQFRKGAQWFSITHDLANFVLSQREELRKIYKFTSCPDEIFLHTLVWNSPFRDRINQYPTRFIDWKRGRPYTFSVDDFELLIQANGFWARKFNEAIDKVIVDKIFAFFSQS